MVEQEGANVNRGSLHKACMFGHLGLVQYLLSKGAKIDLKLANGETCLHTCKKLFSLHDTNYVSGAFYGQKDILEMLINEASINLFERTSDGKTALMLAVY